MRTRPSGGAHRVGRWRRGLKWPLAGAGLAVLLAGCWPQPGFDAGRTDWNSSETTLTAANVDGLEVRWETEIASLSDIAGSAGISVDGSLYTTTDDGEVVALDARTGAVRWRQQIVDPANAERVGDLVYEDESIHVAYVTSGATVPPFDSAGGVARLDPATGAILGRSEGQAVEDIATQSGEVASQTFSLEYQGTTATGVAGIDWAHDPQVVCNWNAGHCPTTFAFVGERIIWSQGNSILGFSSACPPGPRPGTCGPDWSTDVGAPLGRHFADVAAVGADKLVHNLPDGFVVLDAVTGQELWRARTAASYPALAVADGMIVAANRSGGALWAFPADGCGAANCVPRWSGSLATGDVPGVTVAGDVVYLSTTRYDANGSTIWAFPLHGCGAGTCEPVTTRRVDHGIIAPLLVDDGRLIAVADTALEGDTSRVTTFALTGT